MWFAASQKPPLSNNHKAGVKPEIIPLSKEGTKEKDKREREA